MDREIGLFLIVLLVFVLYKILPNKTKDDSASEYLDSKELENGHVHTWRTGHSSENLYQFCTQCGYIPSTQKYMPEAALKECLEACDIVDELSVLKQETVDNMAQQLGLDDRMVEKIFNSGYKFKEKSLVAVLLASKKDEVRKIMNEGMD